MTESGFSRSISVGLPTECGGGLPLSECLTTKKLLQQVEGWRPDWDTQLPRRWNVLKFLERSCVKCKLDCLISVEVIGDSPTGNVRLEYTEKSRGSKGGLEK